MTRRGPVLDPKRDLAGATPNPQRLERSQVRYSDRGGGPNFRSGSNIDASPFANEGQVSLRFEVGNLRGNTVTLNLHHQDFRKMLDLMVDAHPTTALREMAAVVAKALAESNTCQSE